MAKKVAPGVICRVIGGNAGPKSPNIGRLVKVLNQHTNPDPHSLWDVIWECAPADGKGGFPIKRDHVDEFGTGATTQTIACFADEWLEPLDEEEPKKAMETERQRELVD